MKPNPRRYNPPIEERESDQLVHMAWNPDEYWHPEASELASKELSKRGVPIDYQERLITEWKKQYARNEEIRNRIFENNAKERYKLWQLFIVFIISPALLTAKISYDLSLWELKEQNYLLKLKQRRIAYFSGLIAYTTIIVILTRI